MLIKTSLSSTTQSAVSNFDREKKSLLNVWRQARTKEQVVPVHHSTCRGLCPLLMCVRRKQQMAHVVGESCREAFFGRIFQIPVSLERSCKSSDLVLRCCRLLLSNNIFFGDTYGDRPKRRSLKPCCQLSPKHYASETTLHRTPRGRVGILTMCGDPSRPTDCGTTELDARMECSESISLVD